MSKATKMPTTLDEIRATVAARYGATAKAVADGAAAASCCGPAGESSGCCGATNETWDPITADLYDAGQTAGSGYGFVCPFASARGVVAKRSSIRAELCARGAPVAT